MSIIALILILVVCILVEGFFSGSEIALVNADKFRLALAVDAGSRRALSALHMVKHPAKFFATTLLGTNICTVTGSVVTTLFIIDRFGASYAALAILYWPFTLILGELVPKSIYQYYADKIVMRVAPVLFGASVVLYPIIWLLSKFTDKLLGTVAKRESTEPSISREELEIILDVGHPEKSDMQLMERTMISRIFDLADKRIKNIMTPLVDVVAIPISSSRDEASSILEKQGFSRIPVYEGRVFNVVGVLEGFELLFGKKDASVKELSRPAFYVPEEMPLDELLLAMKRKGEQIAVAVDEYGGATGLVTAEDLLEEVVGEIRDEHDESATPYVRLGWHHYLINGRMEIDDVNEKLKLDIPLGDYKTIAGFMIHKLEKIPKVGENFQSGQFIFTVRRATERAVIDIEVSEI